MMPKESRLSGQRGSVMKFTYVHCLRALAQLSATLVYYSVMVRSFIHSVWVSSFPLDLFASFTLLASDVVEGDEGGEQN